MSECYCFRGRAGAVLRDVPKKQFPRGPSRFSTVVFSKEDLQDLKNVQSPGAYLPGLQASGSRRCMQRCRDAAARKQQHKLQFVVVGRVLGDKVWLFKPRKAGLAHLSGLKPLGC